MPIKSKLKKNVPVKMIVLSGCSTTLESGTTPGKKRTAGEQAQAESEPILPPAQATLYRSCNTAVSKAEMALWFQQRRAERKADALAKYEELNERAFGGDWEQD
jgi:hypothetical protein